ncbi:DUF1643 domain-containing protein [Rodentibacter caecimuris]|uniref:DUF1643 domain-containing protein n=6 Tax=Rodentibacter caecimuris TaxID=1796644 RepID=UPI0007518584|nr:DUF1643 domain-containing protein [Rodentibacter heylii]AOF52955.1 hypothetical protein AC062_0860 [Pasteurellaceae bacterium NI1060]MCX2961318.1 DUF1643 domain-containing protein [Rodentibacter heylii]QIA77155.1 DUF1643 domain-containing protein [Rodentibacter heylii]
MDYNIEIYETDEYNQCRFALGNIALENITNSTLFVFGINPSTADDQKPDHTIKKVIGFAEHNSYSSFVMFNVYPLRETYPYKLPPEMNDDIFNQNLNVIKEILSDINNPHILLAYGKLINSRNYLRPCLNQIYREIQNLNQDIKWLRIGPMLVCGHPRHPLYAPYRYKLEEIDMDRYLSNDTNN